MFQQLFIYLYKLIQHFNLLLQGLVQWNCILRKHTTRQLHVHIHIQVHVDLLHNVVRCGDICSKPYKYVHALIRLGLVRVQG